MNTADLDDIWGDLDTAIGDQIRWMRGDPDFVADHDATIFALPLRFGGMGCAPHRATRSAARACFVQLATRTYVDVRRRRSCRGRACSPWVVHVRLVNDLSTTWTSGVLKLTTYLRWHHRAQLYRLALHTLNLTSTNLNGVSALPLFPALHTLNLNNSQVSDVSLLASCQALRTLRLYNTKVSDLFALVSCQALHTLDLMHEGYVYAGTVPSSAHTSPPQYPCE
jgi:hypothetical protein